MRTRQLASPGRLGATALCQPPPPVQGEGRSKKDGLHEMPDERLHFSTPVWTGVSSLAWVRPSKATSATIGADDSSPASFNIY